MTYFPRATLFSLTRQYFLYGRGCARTLEKHASLPRLRQMLPPLVLLYGVAALALVTVAPALLILLAVYAGGCGLSGLALALKAREPMLVMSGPAAIAMHLPGPPGSCRIGAIAGRCCGLRYAGSRPCSASRRIGPGERQLTGFPARRPRESGVRSRTPFRIRRGILSRAVVSHGQADYRHAQRFRTP